MNPNRVAAALDGGARVDRGLTPRRSDADGEFCFVARTEGVVRRREQANAGAEFGRIVNLAAAAATQP